jgi:DNA-binding MarR family transcriptional regulator
MQKHLTLEERVIVALRRITRSVDMHSDFMQRNFGLTGPQLTILRVIKRLQPISAGELARTANFNPGTLTGIFDRLEANGFISRKRHAPDRRTVILRLTAAGNRVLAEAPFLLRQHCLDALDAMPADEQAALLNAVERLAHLMEADSPIAAPRPDRSPDTVDQISGRGVQ